MKTLQIEKSHERFWDLLKASRCVHYLHPEPVPCWPRSSGSLTGLFWWALLDPEANHWDSWKCLNCYVGRLLLERGQWDEVCPSSPYRSPFLSQPWCHLNPLGNRTLITHAVTFSLIFPFRELICLHHHQPNIRWLFCRTYPLHFLTWLSLSFEQVTYSNHLK